MNSGTLRPLDALGRTHPDHLEPYIWFRVRAAQIRPELSPPECSRESRSRTNERTIFRRVPKVRACMCVCVSFFLSLLSFFFIYFLLFDRSVAVVNYDYKSYFAFGRLFSSNFAFPFLLPIQCDNFCRILRSILLSFLSPFVFSSLRLCRSKSRN